MTSNATIPAGQMLPALIRDAYPTHTAKRAAIAAGVPHETARNWVRGRAAPSLPFLLRWAAKCDLMASALERQIDDARRARRCAAADRSISPVAAQGESPALTP
jgi:hypothetical protein